MNISNIRIIGKYFDPIRSFGAQFLNFIHNPADTSGGEILLRLVKNCLVNRRRREGRVPFQTDECRDKSAFARERDKTVKRGITTSSESEGGKKKSEHGEE